MTMLVGAPDMATEALLGLSAVLAVLLVITTTALVTVSAALRRARRVRRRRVQRGAELLELALHSPQTARLRHTLPALTASGPRRGALLVRRDLLVAVSAASDAVRFAAQSQAPVGDLPRLCGELDRSARTEAKVLLSAPAAGLDAAQTRARELVRLADDVRAAALEAVARCGAPVRRTLAEDVATEVAAVRAGATSAGLGS